jgi:hypothetical protein
MSKLLQVGLVFANEMKSGIGHVAVTLGGVNYECRGGKGVIKGSSARGAGNKLFKHHFFMVLTNARAAEAKKWADSCVGGGYDFGGMQVPPPPKPGKAGDCSSYASSIVAVALGKKPKRLFATGTFMSKFKALGFSKGLGPGAAEKMGPGIGVLDRPYPGSPVGVDDKRISHVKWIQARLNFAAKNKHAVLEGKALDVDGEYGSDTEKVVIAFQKKHGLKGQGMCGQKTWPLLNAIR